MIEISRYMLATIVAQTHLWPRGPSWTGQISVFAFYTLSGYLMTRVLNERYGFTIWGTAAFLLNRVLRLWPAYLVIMVPVIVALGFLPLHNFFPLIRMPTTAADIITNVTYHLFIAHMPVAAILVIGLHIRANSIVAFLATLGVAFGLSAFLVPMERRIDSARRQIALIARRNVTDGKIRTIERPVPL